MSAYHQGRASWMDPGTYPVQEKLIDGASTKESDVFIVDVGGNKGHDLEEFRSKWPTAPGRLILQDRPQVLGDIKSLNSAIEPMEHDFYTEQPVKGECVFFRVMRKVSLTTSFQVPAYTFSTPFSMIGVMKRAS